MDPYTDGIPHLEDLHEHADLATFVDIRDTAAYRAFVNYVGGIPTNLQENGFDILAPDYQRELQYAAGNLMQIHLRDIVKRSVDTIVNYFRGFPTLATIKKSIGTTNLRRVDIRAFSIYSKEAPVLKLPEVFDLQDYLCPIFKLSVTFGKTSHKKEVNLSH